MTFLSSFRYYITLFLQVYERFKNNKTVSWMHNSRSITFEDDATSIDCYRNRSKRVDTKTWIGDWIILNDSCKYFKHQNHSLTIFDLSYEDVGNATCTVDTELGIPEKITHLIVEKIESSSGWWFLPWLKLIITVLGLFFVLFILCIFFRKVYYRRAGGKYTLDPNEDEFYEKLTKYLRPDANKTNEVGIKYLFK